MYFQAGVSYGTLRMCLFPEKEEGKIVKGKKDDGRIELL